MTRQYKNIGEITVQDVDPGKEFTAQLTPEEEQDLIQSGRVAIVPQSYKNIGTSVVCGAKPGRKFKAALTIGEENALIEGGHIEREKE